ncbi:MAG: hypothetical protein IPI73_12385 [Betaproteobacteria bacterium]|nr:hypothetical protein [Betaproteobacteria bacterium]
MSARSLVAALALSGGDYRVDGVPRMRERPIRDLVDALRQAGAAIDYAGADGCFPLHIAPGAIDTAMPVRRARRRVQPVLTGLSLALPPCGTSAAVVVGRS